MAIAQALPVAQGTSGLFGLASVGVGLRVGLQAIQGNEEAAARIAEAREAARERLAQSRDDAGRTEQLQRTAASERPVTSEQDGVQDDTTADGFNSAPSADAFNTGRGGLLDVTI
jgi:hypothetical protein